MANLVCASSSSLSISRLDIKSQYSPGQFIDGSFELLNKTNESIPDIYSIITIYGPSDARGVRKVYETRYYGPFRFEKNEQKIMRIHYPLSTYISGEHLLFSVSAQTKSGETFSPQSSVEFNVPGKMKLRLNEAMLSAGSLKYPSNVIPVIEDKNVKLSLHVKVQNMSLGEIASISKVTVRKNSALETPIFSYTLPEVVFNPGVTEFTIPIELASSSAPGLYVAKVFFLDKRFARESEEINFSYKVVGKSISIGDIRFDKLSVEQGKPIKVTVNYDTHTFIDPANDNSQIHIKLSSLDREVISESVETLDLSRIHGQKVFNLIADRDAKKIKVEISIMEAGYVFDSYSLYLIDNTSIVNGRLPLEGAIALALITVGATLVSIILYSKKKALSTHCS